MLKTCERCYFFEVCDGRSVCDDYTPFCGDAAAADEQAEQMIDAGRREFREEWAEYIGQYE